MSTTPFYVDQQVRVTDVNYGNHLGISEICGMAHNARFCFLKSLGVSEADIGGVRIMAIETNIIMKTECFLGDMLRFFVSIAPLSRTQLKCITSILIEDKIVACVEDRLICYDYERKRPEAIPKSFLAIINAFPQENIT